MSRLFAAILLFFCTSVLSAQVQMGASLKSDSSDTVRGKRTYLYMLHADATRGDEARLSDAVILVGDVQLRRDSMYMYCDSAYLFTKRNSVQAFGSVRMEQGDTLFLYGDYADYDGDLNVARVRGNVRLVDKNTVLETDSLNYDRNINLAYYFDGEKTIPLTGLSIAGKLSEVLAEIALSEKCALSGAYFGPEKALISNMNIF